jgi:hypothetical protein
MSIDTLPERELTIRWVRLLKSVQLPAQADNHILIIRPEVIEVEMGK